MALLTEDETRDAAASADTAYTISVNDSFEGVLVDRSDEDWIRVELAQGKNYDIRLSGIGPQALADTLLTIYDSDGVEVASNDDIEREALNLFSMVEFSPGSAGVYYISARGYQGNISGAYEITVFDEQDNNLETPLAVSVGERFQGTLDDKFDEDWIRVDLAAGKTYDITLGGIGADADTDTVLRVYNQEGEQVAFNDDVDYAAGKVNSMLSFSPEAAGAYYLSAGAYRANPKQDNSGRYQVGVYEAGASLALVGTNGEDYLFHLRLKGGPGDDELDGGDGNDWLEGGAGADTLAGGAGHDLASYQYSDAGVEVRLGDGTARGGHAQGDAFAGSKTVPLPLSAGAEEAKQVEIPDIEDLFGSVHDDILVGAYGSNWLQGYYGNDVLDGGEGDDSLFGGGGADALIGGPGIDTAVYAYSDEGVEVNLHTGVGRGGYAEGDTFLGRQVIEYTGPAGETREIEVSDIENLHGSFLHGDVLTGNQNANRINGDGGDDLLQGGPGDDRLYGGAGNDTLQGGPGADWLWGGSGNNALDGGEGDDAFVFGASGGDDAILDFGNGEDRIDLAVFKEIRSVDDLDVQQRDNATVIDLSARGGGTVTLADFDMAGLTDDHFVFFSGDAETIA